MFDLSPMLDFILITVLVFGRKWKWQCWILDEFVFLQILHLIKKYVAVSADDLISTWSRKFDHIIFDLQVGFHFVQFLHLVEKAVPALFFSKKAKIHCIYISPERKYR